MTQQERGQPAADVQEPTAEDSREGRSPDELRLNRSEEALDHDTHRREAGAVRVRKSIRTDREQFSVPKRREEVEVERVPVNREAPEAKLGEDEEVVVPVYEEEVVVTKRVVLKEEIRLRKQVIEEEEVIEEDVRREEVEIDDRTERGVNSARGSDPDRPVGSAEGPHEEDER